MEVKELELGWGGWGSIARGGEVVKREKGMWEGGGGISMFFFFFFSFIYG